MQYEEINEKTIKISLTFQDLVDHDVKLSDFFTNQS
ncbi:MAG TPA: adaptor protein MecA, partial [Lactococcus sp.]|nr:adaptor protein MecA [Lactococcus sp.]